MIKQEYGITVRLVLIIALLIAIDIIIPFVLGWTDKLINGLAGI